MFDTKRIPGLSDAATPASGEKTRALSETVPLKPLTVETLIVEVLSPPWKTVTDTGWACRTKSNALTKTVTLAVALKPSPEPVTLTP